MKPVVILLVLCFQALLWSGCARTQQTGTTAAPEKQEIQSWLESKGTSPAQINMSGNWDAGNPFAGGWGGAAFVQEKNRISGSMGLYDITGVVSGTDLYLGLLSNGRMYYTAKLSRKKDGTFSGTAVKEAYIESDDAKGAEKYPISLNKLN